MAHSHSHSSVQAPDNSNARRLLWAFIVTAGFMLIEAVGGAISGSLALLADAGHMLTDSAALLFALLAVRFARPPPNAPPTFGWLRFAHPGAAPNAIAVVGSNLPVSFTHLPAHETPWHLGRRLLPDK
ncbi:cation transporter, partial [Klebsiella pneumoniae]